jgi:Uma2 family endonuclease
MSDVTSAVLKEPMTLEAFLVWESRQETKYEFDGFHPVAMTGGTSDHSAIATNILIAIGGRLRGGPCRIHGSDLKIRAAGSIRYPDAFVVCSPIPRGTLIVTNPVIVFEVLSPSTSSIDWNDKKREYWQVPSIERYVILEQSRPLVTVFWRSDSDWKSDVIADDGDLSLPEIGITVPLAELYDGVTFPTERDEADIG